MGMRAMLPSLSLASSTRPDLFPKIELSPSSVQKSSRVSISIFFSPNIELRVDFNFYWSIFSNFENRDFWDLSWSGSTWIVFQKFGLNCFRKIQATWNSFQKIELSRLNSIFRRSENANMAQLKPKNRANRVEAEFHAQIELRHSRTEQTKLEKSVLQCVWQCVLQCVLQYVAVCSLLESTKMKQNRSISYEPRLEVGGTQCATGCRNGEGFNSGFALWC